jgi:hypothetical protein
MNLVELLVASSLVLGSTTGSLGIWARTAQATHDTALRLRQELQAEEQLLAVQARLQSLAAERRAAAEPSEPPPGCPGLADLQPVVPAPDADPAATLDLQLDATGEILTARAAAAAGYQRERMFDLVVYGLCAGAS